MAYDKVVDSAILDGALTGIADAIRSKTGGTEKLTMEGMAAAISGIQTGGGGGLELVYTGAFSITEVNTVNTQVDEATLQTGLTMPGGVALWCVIKCEKDTWDDTSFKHIRARTQGPCIYRSGSVATNTSSGIIYTDDGNINGLSGGLWVSKVTTGAASVTISTKYVGGIYGIAPTGDYSVKLYRIVNKYIGLEEVI